MLRVVLRTLRPNLWGFLLVGLALGAGGLGLGLVGLIFDSITDWGSVLFAVLFFAGTPLSVGLVLAGLAAGRQAPRAWLFGAAFVIALVGAAFTAVFLTVGEGVVTALGVVLLFFGPALLISGAPALGYGIGGVAEILEAIDIWRRGRVLEEVTRAGRAEITALADLVGLTPEEVSVTLADRIDDGTLTGRLEPEHGWFWSAEVLQKGLSGLSERAVSEGQVELGELARGLDVPEDVARRWIYEAVHRGRFTGYVNWKTGVLFSADASQLRAGRECPVCGGKLDLTGSGSARCGHCGSDMLLGAA